MMLLLLSVLTLSTLILYGIDFSFRFYSHFILSMFVHGVSGGKVYFLLIYSTIVFLLLYFRRGKSRIPWPMESCWAGKLLVLLMLLGIGASLGSYLHYIKAYSLPVETYHYHFKGIYNSVNYFPHIHTSKLYLYKVGSVLGLERALENMDDGRVFVNVIPAFYPYVTLFSILFIIFLSLFSIPRIVNRWEGRNKTGISILSVLSFNSIIKCLSDGGPFAYDFLVAIGVIYILMHTKGPEELKAFLRGRWRVFFWVSFGILSLECLIDPSLGIATYTLQHGLVILGIYSFIYLMTIRNTLKNRLLKWIFLAALTLFLSNTVYVRYSIFMKPFLAYLDEGTEIHYFYYKDNHLPERLRGSRVKFDSNFLSIYSFSIEKREKVLNLYKTLGENPYRNRHVAIISPKKRKAYGILARIIFLEFERREVALRVSEIFYLKLTEEDLNRKRFRGEIAFDPSYFPALSHAEGGRLTQLDENHKFVMYYFLNRFFHHSGVKEYILTPLSFYRFN
jgi:hypothetical protein